MMFRKAERKQAKLRLCLAGPSGSGKTYSSIKLAKGLGGKIAMIDTEHGSGELYADLAEYDVVTLDAPYSPERYIRCIKEAERANYQVLIIDSLSHAWSGEGGVLEMVDKAAKASRSGNSYTAWRDVTPQHNQLVEAILTSDMHIVTTMRTKTEYVMETNEKGKTNPRKVGMAPIQRDGMEYEFTVVLDLSIDGHLASASKDRTRLFDGKHDVPNEKMGEMLLEWLNTGEKEEKPEPKKKPEIAKNSQKSEIVDFASDVNAPYKTITYVFVDENDNKTEELSATESFDYLSNVIMNIADKPSLDSYLAWKQKNAPELRNYFKDNMDDGFELANRYKTTVARIKEEL